MTGMALTMAGSCVAFIGAFVLAWTDPTVTPVIGAWRAGRGWRRWTLPLSFALLGTGLVLQVLGGLLR